MTLALGIAHCVDFVALLNLVLQKHQQHCGILYQVLT